MPNDIKYSIGLHSLYHIRTYLGNRTVEGWALTLVGWEHLHFFVHHDDGWNWIVSEVSTGRLVFPESTGRMTIDEAAGVALEYLSSHTRESVDSYIKENKWDRGSIIS